MAARGEYARCEERDPFPGAVARIHVLDTVAEPVGVADADRVDSTAVRIRTTLEAQDPFEQVFHAVPVDGRRTWFLPQVRSAAYRAGRCP